MFCKNCQNFAWFFCQTYLFAISRFSIFRLQGLRTKIVKSGRVNDFKMLISPKSTKNKLIPNCAVVKNCFLAFATNSQNRIFEKLSATFLNTRTHSQTPPKFCNFRSLYSCALSNSSPECYSYTQKRTKNMNILPTEGKSASAQSHCSHLRFEASDAW